MEGASRTTDTAGSTRPVTRNTATAPADCPGCPEFATGAHMCSCRLVAGHQTFQRTTADPDLYPHFIHCENGEAQIRDCESYVRLYDNIQAIVRDSVAGIKTDTNEIRGSLDKIREGLWDLTTGVYLLAFLAGMWWAFMRVVDIL